MTKFIKFYHLQLYFLLYYPYIQTNGSACRAINFNPLAPRGARQQNYTIFSQPYQLFYGKCHFPHFQTITFVPLPEIFSGFYQNSGANLPENLCLLLIRTSSFFSCSVRPCIYHSFH